MIHHKLLVFVRIHDEYKIHFRFFVLHSEFSKKNPQNPEKIIKQLLDKVIPDYLKKEYKIGKHRVSHLTKFIVVFVDILTKRFHVLLYASLKTHLFLSKWLVNTPR